MEKSIIQSLITPNAQTINQVFSKKERYFIDIYQRDYKWEKEQIETLLKDIELHFNLSKRLIDDPKEIKKDIKENFKPYFLNTYLTSETPNHVAIVDGQQRLTTFLIMLIALRNIAKIINENQVYSKKTVSINTLDKLIFEADDFAEPEYFKIFNPDRQEAFNFILGKNKSYKPKYESQIRIVENHELIKNYFQSFLTSQEDTDFYDVSKFTYYIYYVLEKLNIVEIRIEQQENVATIFEVVNDRGKGLKSYEILKGKILGNLSFSEKNKANDIWVGLQNKYYNSRIVFSNENKIDLDTFFKAYLRAKFANTENDYKKFEEKYHYEIYRNTKILKFFGNFTNTSKLFKWVNEDFRYFAELHLHIRTTYQVDYLIFNKLLNQNQQYILILSAIEFEDEQKEEKIEFVSKKFDQMHSTIRLLDAYDSNTFQELIYKILPKIRNKSLVQIEDVFNSTLIGYLEAQGIITKDAYKTIGELYKYELFQNMRNRWLNFSKYSLMRIDYYLAKSLDKPSYCLDALEGLEDRFNKNNRKRYGMHLEHIFAHNDRNKALFTRNDIFDESTFNTVRNKLGVVLLLKDKQNQSSNNDYYKKKINDYATSNIIWNELMVGHIDHIDKRNLPSSIEFTKIEPDLNGVFPYDKVEQRQRETFGMFKMIWGF
jgi:uncharacterized protein with ParB-like and HNH nuclease domain